MLTGRDSLHLALDMAFAFCSNSHLNDRGDDFLGVFALCDKRGTRVMLSRLSRDYIRS